MGCNCKRVREIDELYNHTKSKLDSTNRYLTEKIFSYFTNFFDKFIILILLLIMFPLVILSLLISVVIHGRLQVYTPKFMRKELHKQIKELEKLNGEQ